MAARKMGRAHLAEASLALRLIELTLVFTLLGHLKLPVPMMILYPW